METRLPAVPLLLPLGALTAGILAAVFADIGFGWLVAAAAAGAIVAVASRRRGAGAALLVFGAGALSGGLAKPAMPDFDSYTSAPAVFCGRVEEVRCVDVMQYLTVSTDSAAGVAVTPFRVRVTLESALPPVAPGDRVRFRTTLLPPSSADGRLPSGADMEAWCLRNRVSALAPEVDAQNFAITGYSPGFDTRMALWRDRLSDAILGSGLSADCAELTAALVTGDRRFLDPSVQEDFRGAGLAHVLALSGTHIAIIAFMVSVLLFPLRLAGKRNWQNILTIALLWGYALFTGMAPSVVRAVIMASMLMAGQMFRRQTVPLNSLCAAALLILFFRPFDLFAVGFQLTFLAVAAILMFAWPASKIRRVWLRIPAQWVALSLSAVVGTAPLAAWYFHTFPSNFLLSNLAMAILLPLFMAGGILSSLAGPGGGILITFTDSLFNLCAGMAHTLARSGAGEINGIIFTPWALLPYYLALGAFWYAILRRRIIFAVNGLLLMVLAVFLTRLTVYPSFEAYPTGNRYATVILAREKNHAYIFTDAGPSSQRLIKRTIPYIADDYLRTHNVDTVSIACNGLRTDNLRYSTPEWVIGPKRYVVPHTAADLNGILPYPDYLIVSQGFISPIKEITDRLRPRHIIISPRYNSRRRYALADTIMALGYPVTFRY